MAFLALIARRPVQHQVDSLLRVLSAVTPPDVLDAIHKETVRAARASDALVAFSAGAAICGTSMAAVTLMGALNEAFDVVERRRWANRRALGVAFTAMLAAVVLTALLLLLVGPAAVAWAAGYAWAGHALAIAGTWLIWPLIVLPVLVSIAVVYQVGPNRTGPWLWITPGSIVAAGLWLVTSLAFTCYARNVVDDRASYGGTGAVVIVGLGWFYLSALAVVVGGELDGVLYQHWREQVAAESPPCPELGSERGEVRMFPARLERVRAVPETRET